jgi:adenylate cyclase
MFFFPFALKCALVVSFLAAAALSAITIISYLTMSRQARAQAARDVKSINRTTAAVCETFFDSVRAESAAAMFVRNKEFFWQLNPHIAALAVLNASNEEYIYENDTFMRTNQFNAGTVEQFIQTQRPVLYRISGEETVLFSTMKDAGDFPLLVMRSRSQAQNGAVYIFTFFSAESLRDMFTSSDYVSYVTNDIDEDILCTGRKNQQEIISGKQYLSRYGCSAVTYIETGIVLENAVQTALRNIYIILISWASAALTMLLFSFSITRRLNSINEMFQKIEEGVCDISIPVTTHDETGILIKNINDMAESAGLFERYSNRQEAVFARQGIISMEGMRKTATVLFSDIYSFTECSSKLKAEQIMTLLNDYMKYMTACITATGGIVDKFIGDSIMAHWGAAETAKAAAAAETRGALAAVRSALLMRAAGRCFNEGRGTAFTNPALATGFGITTGQFSAGLFNAGGHAEWTLTGSGLRLADRLTACAAKSGADIIISAETRRLTGNCLITEELESITFNGHREQVFAVINIKDANEMKKFSEELECIPSGSKELYRRAAGPDGPKSLAALRSLR